MILRLLIASKANTITRKIRTIMMPIIMYSVSIGRDNVVVAVAVIRSLTVVDTVTYEVNV